METITLTPEIHHKNILRDYFLRCAQRRQPRGGASPKQRFKRECLKNNGYTFDL